MIDGSSEVEASSFRLSLASAANSFPHMPGRRCCCSVNFGALAGALLLFAFGGGACHKGDSSAKRLLTAGPLQPCKLPGINEELLCGKLTVFENRETRSGRTIDLNVVVLPALDSRSKEEPLFDLEGGPGVASTAAGADFYAKEGKEYRRHSDVVLVDQRGTGKSNPLAAPARTRRPKAMPASGPAAARW